MVSLSENLDQPRALTLLVECVFSLAPFSFFQSSISQRGKKREVMVTAVLKPHLSLGIGGFAALKDSLHNDMKKTLALPALDGDTDVSSCVEGA